MSNGEDPEAVAQVVELAMEFRREFRRDVVVDMYCYRRLGHNESDEPRFTQPIMYRTIDDLKTVRDSYLQRMLSMNGITQEEADNIARTRREQLQEEFDSAKKKTFTPDTQTLEGLWSPYYGGRERDDDHVETGVPTGKLTYVIQKICEAPETFNIHPKLQRVLRGRAESAEGKRPVDWATAELGGIWLVSARGAPGPAFRTGLWSRDF